MDQRKPDESPANGKLFASHDWRAAMLLPVAIAFSAILSLQFGIDWWEAFGPTLTLLMLGEWLCRWFTAPGTREAGPGLTPPELVVPNEAKRGMIVAVGIVAAVVALIWLF